MNAPTSINIDKRVEQYIALRDKIKSIKERHKEELSPYNETLEKLNSVLLGHLNTVGVDNAGTQHGTVYRTRKKSASIQDMTAFWSFCVTQGNFDLVDKRANVTAVEAYINEQVEAAKADPSIVPGPPPGVNFTVLEEVGVQRAATKK
jgi:hypothetical protein